MTQACSPPCADLLVLQKDVDNLRDEKEQMAKSIVKLDEKIDKLIFWMMTAAVGIVGTFIISLLTLFINFMVKKG